MSTLRSFIRLFFALLLAFACGAAQAQQFPNKPIRLVNPFPPGAPTDILGRMVAQRLSDLLGVNVVPDNRAGAGGNVGIELVAKSLPNGYTLGVFSCTVSISPSLYANLPYNAEKELAAVARLAAIHNVLLVRPSLPVKTLREFIELARSQPGKLNFGSGGAGTTNHLANELLMYLEKIKMVHVPYKGATVAVTSLIGGEVDEVTVSAATVVEQVRTGKVRALAVLSEKRLGILPEVPTAMESGVKDFVMFFWAGMFAPAGTPRDVILRLNRTTVAALTAPDFRDKLSATGFEPWPSTADEFASFVKAETARFGAIIRNAGLRANM